MDVNLNNKIPGIFLNVNKLPINSAPLPLPKGVDRFKRYVDKRYHLGRVVFVFSTSLKYS